MYVWDGSQWVKASAATTQTYVVYEYTATAGQTTFSGADLNSVSLAYTAPYVQVFLNGVMLMPGDDYTATNGTSIVLVSGATAGDSVAAIAYSSFNVANVYTQAQVDALIAANGGAKGGGSDHVFFENDLTVTTNYTITSSKNAVTAGPVSINSGVTVTVPTGSVWVVV